MCIQSEKMWMSFVFKEKINWHGHCYGINESIINSLQLYLTSCSLQMEPPLDWHYNYWWSTSLLEGFQPLCGLEKYPYMHETKCWNVEAKFTQKNVFSHRSFRHLMVTPVRDFTWWRLQMPDQKLCCWLFAKLPLLCQTA